MKILIIIVKFFFSLAVNGLMIVYVGLWWNLTLLPSPNGIESNLLRAVFLIFVFGLFSIDGYSKYYKRNEKIFYMFSSISPILLSMFGFVFGLYVTYLQ